MLSKIITTAAIMATVASATAIRSTTYGTADCSGDSALVTFEVSAIKFNAHNPSSTTLAKNAKNTILFAQLLNSLVLLFCPSPPTFTLPVRHVPVRCGL